jgi:pimeloyl-ACP methyl ester carboxylesterase
MGEEYTRFHRLYHLLAQHLLQAGFPVMRFDFYGCGDSEGDFEQARIDHWLADVSMAIDELRRRSNASTICLAGLRLGGTLAMMAGAERGDVRGLVLWDPVADGPAYLQDLGDLHQYMLRWAHVRPPLRQTGEGSVELLGYPFADSLRADLENLDLATAQQRPADHVLVVESHEAVSQQNLVERLGLMDIRVEYQRLPQPQVWLWREDVGRALVAYPLLQAVVRWVSEVFA